jgi:CheY-like chemotaxis protein
MTSATATATIPAPATITAPATPTATVAPSARAKILIIEDYPDTRELLSALLRGKGYNVIEAEDGLEGLLKAGWLYPDLIIMDLSLPEMDGVETARRIHAQAKLSRIPIFVVSAYLTEEVEAHVREVGCVEVFAKPFDADTLIDKVSATLNPAGV